MTDRVCSPLFVLCCASTVKTSEVDELGLIHMIVGIFTLVSFLASIFALTQLHLSEPVVAREIDVLGLRQKWFHSRSVFWTRAASCNDGRLVIQLEVTEDSADIYAHPVYLLWLHTPVPQTCIAFQIWDFILWLELQNQEPILTQSSEASFVWSNTAIILNFFY